MLNFYGVEGFYRWVRTPSGKSFRSKIVKGGLLVVIHRPTGRFIMQVSGKVSADVDKIIKLLDNGKHKCKLFNQLVEMDSDLELLEFKCSETVAKQHIKTIMTKLGKPNQYLRLA